MAAYQSTGPLLLTSSTSYNCLQSKKVSTSMSRYDMGIVAGDGSRGGGAWLRTCC